MSPSKSLPATTRLATRLLHADHAFTGDSAVSPDISVSTTFRQKEYEGDLPPTVEDVDMANPQSHVYSRYTQPISTRVEKVLGQICNGHAVTYSSGLSAAYAALLHFKPKRIAIRGGYHGCHQAIALHQRSGVSVEVVDIDDEYKPGDLAWIETPVNPLGEARDLQYYADKVHAVGGKIIVDATFAPPPLQDPFLWGVDCVMHSGTKYFGGHSDLLAGILVVRTPEEWLELWTDRTFLGNVMGSLESFLLLRSLRTFELRIRKQAASATILAQWLDRLSTVPAGQTWDGAPGGVIKKVFHTSLQKETFVKRQMSGGDTPTFAMVLLNASFAKNLPHKLKYFTAATSLGGVESLIEQRRMSDPNADPTLIRISTGIEDVEDLKDDFRQAFKTITAPTAKL